MEPKLYNELSPWWPLLSPPEEYVEEAEFFAQQLMAAGTDPRQTLLELGSGGGNNASYLKKQFSMTLVDPSTGMLAHSRKLNPDCEHLQGDMRTIRLDRQFDRVFIHDAIAYMTTLEDLRKAIDTAFVHCRPGGAALFAPDHLVETFESSTDHGGSDNGQSGLWYLEWTWDPDPSDSTYVVDYAYMMRDSSGAVHVEHDRHIEGLFSRGDWLRILADAGFQPCSVPFDHSELEPGSYEVLIGIKP